MPQTSCIVITYYLIHIPTRLTLTVSNSSSFLKLENFSIEEAVVAWRSESGSIVIYETFEHSEMAEHQLENLKDENPMEEDMEIEAELA